MLYTLLNFLVWGLLLALIGGVVGWALRSLTARRGSAPSPVGDVDDADGRRYRLADFDAVVAERDRLRTVLASMRQADAESTERSSGSTSPERSSSPVALRSDMIERRAVARHDFDVAVAEAVLSRPIRLDDLTVIDGIGPKIAELCSGIGVTTWAQLARTDVATLRSMLDDAGRVYKLRDPRTWPDQAAMLASGRWHDFKAFTASRRG